MPLDYSTTPKPVNRAALWATIFTVVGGVFWILADGLPVQSLGAIAAILYFPAMIARHICFTFFHLFYLPPPLWAQAAIAWAIYFGLFYLVARVSARRPGEWRRILSAFVFAAVVTTTGFYLWAYFMDRLAGNILFYPGLLAENLHMWIYCKLYSCPIIDDPWETEIVSGVSWLLYFLAFYLILRWRARRKAARESAAAQEA
jgi:hypothetical protein